ncbi:hypothetical protein [Curtobacterium flaccumfaciens]|uniref:hypothetical protein n=1 Tax=Curtobacterium flaccumfaciens TaxID=2035 RepID=UPI001366CBBC|nr:hypothetical protein [Curtobacterium flaccumfaciens]MBT1665778.1 hypothetical protein [Curtobacterium flaccumfaciens pv. flaccumfaciens]QFS80508.2 hypothetical protein GBG65_17030 [Curtobacterium flaccumfaciens pv. flaccumfaciens]
MRRSVRLLTVLVIVTLFAVGVLSAVVFIQRVLADPASDVAWVGTVRAMGFIVIGVMLTLLGRRSMPAAVEAINLLAGSGPVRPLTVVVWVVLGATIYSILRGWTVIVPVAAVVGAIVVALPFVERFLDAALARQAARADADAHADAATPVAPVPPAGTAADA